jgi:hypothetical protein
LIIVRIRNQFPAVLLSLLFIFILEPSLSAQSAPDSDPEITGIEKPKPRIEEVGKFDMGGAYAIGDTYQFTVESQAQFGLRIDRDWLFLYRHQDWTPFVNGDQFGRIQPDILTLTDEARLYRALSPQLALGIAARNAESFKIDRPGSSSLTAVGPAFRWQSMAGHYSFRAEGDISPIANGDGRADGDYIWQLSLQVDRPMSKVWPIFWNVDHTLLRLSAEAQGIAGTADGDPYSLRIGPEIVFPTRQGNDLRLFTQYWSNQDNPLSAPSEEDAALVGIAVSSRAWDPESSENLDTSRLNGVPSISGRYDLGISSDFWMSRFDLYGDAFSFEAFDHPWTLIVDYTHRRKLGIEDEDLQNSGYWVSVGLETPLPWRIADQIMLAGLDFSHRSDHALDFTPERQRDDVVAYDRKSGRVLSTDMNVFPRFRLESRDWGNPVPPRELLQKRGWVGSFDWRLCGGWDFEAVDDGDLFSSFIGARSDLLGLGSYLLYVEGAAGAGSETPDWSAESGFRGRRHRIFARYEDWGIPSRLGGEEVGLLGASWHF